MASMIVYLIVLTLMCLSKSEDLIIGDQFTSRMSFNKVDLQGFWLLRRSTTVLFKYPFGTFIRGIACIDLSPGKTGRAYIIDGGIFDYYVKIGFVSAVGQSLEYTVEIFSEEFRVLHADGKRKKKNKKNSLYLFSLKPYKNSTNSVLEKITHNRRYYT